MGTLLPLLLLHCLALGSFPLCVTIVTRLTRGTAAVVALVRAVDAAITTLDNVTVLAADALTAIVSTWLPIGAPL